MEVAECSGTPTAAHAAHMSVLDADQRSPLTPEAALDMFSPVSVLIGRSGLGPLRVHIPKGARRGAAARRASPRGCLSPGRSWRRGCGARGGRGRRHVRLAQHAGVRRRAAAAPRAAAPGRAARALRPLGARACA
jgi:hypothetical protein